MKNKKRIVIIILIILALVIVLALLFGRRKKKSKAASVTTGTVKYRSIANSVTGTGTVQAVNSVEVTSNLVGSKIKSINVNVGDMVSPGTLLLTIDTSSEEEELNSLNQTLLDNKKSAAEREAAIKKAEEDQKKYLEEASEAERQSLEASQSASINAINEQINTLSSQYNDQEARVSKAENELNDMKSQYDLSLTNGVITSGSQEDLQYQTLILSKETEVNTLKQNLDTLKTGIDTLNTRLNGLQNSAQGNNGSDQMNALNLNSKDKGFFSSLYSASDSAENTSESMLKSQIKSLKKKIESKNVLAQSGGTITEIYAKPGSLYLGNTLMLIESADNMQIVSTVDEYDIADIKVGMEAKVKTDSTRDEILDAEVSFVSPKAESGGSSDLGTLSSLIGGSGNMMSSGLFSSGSESASYKVILTLKKQNERLRMGMNANISIVTSEKENALTVPYDAVKKDGNGSYVTVRTKADNEKGYIDKKVRIRTGIEGTDYIEVLSDDLKEGDKVVYEKAKTDDSVKDLMNMMGSDAGI